MNPEQLAHIIQRYASESITCIKTKGNLEEVVHRQDDIISLAHDIISELTKEPCDSDPVELTQP